jgi:hypothetical protein
MLHAIYMEGNRVDSRLLVVRNQTANLTPDLSFGHTCVLSVQMGHLDIYVSIGF